MRRYKWWMT